MPKDINSAVAFALFRHGVSGLETLIGKRSGPPFQGSWAFPGGHCQQNEPLDDAAVRELKEETGLTPHCFGFIMTRNNPITTALYAGLAGENSEPKSNSDLTDVCWVPTTQLPELAFDGKDNIDLAISFIYHNSVYEDRPNIIANLIQD